MKMEITHLSGSINTNQTRRTEATQYVNELVEKISIELKQTYQNEGDLKTAEIALAVCSKLLEAHFFNLAEIGKHPID